MAYFSFALLFLTAHGVVTSGCIIKFIDGNPSYKNIWDTYDDPRILDNCACGDHHIPTSTSASTVEAPPWNVYVHTGAKTCTGTIIASNLVVTSHLCLLQEKQSHLRMADYLKFRHGESSVTHVGDITITNSKDKSGDQYAVLDIMYNPQFVMSSERQLSNPKEPLVDDLVLLKVDTNFISTGEAHKLICVPPYNSEVTGIRENGMYYSYLRDSSSANSPPTDNNVEILQGHVIKKTDCFSNPKGDDMLCIKHEDQPKPIAEGGPLIVSSHHSAFLLGISEKQPESELHTFTAVAPLARFLQHFGKLSGSKWCRAAKFQVTVETKEERQEKEKAKEKEPDPALERPWPWENGEAIVRDEVLNCTCGKSNIAISGRIAGGQDTAPREFGWMTMLKMYFNGKGSGGAFCGGSVITDRLILTASHCVTKDSTLYRKKSKGAIDPENVDVTLMAHQRSGDPEGITVPVSAVLVHPQYVIGRIAQRRYYDADVALLVLKEPLQFPEKGPGIRPICLHKNGEYEEVVGRQSWAVGWGLTNPDTGSIPDKLQKVELPIAELTLCSDVATAKVTDNFLCAGTLNRFKDAARGDSGGPLQLENPTTRQWYQVGAVSWGQDVEKNGKTLTAALYADLQKLMGFIDYHAKRVGSKWCGGTSGDDNMDYSSTESETKDPADT